MAGPARCLLEQGQHALLRLVGLGQHGRGGLRNDLRAGQLSRGLGKISVLHAAAGGRGVGGDVGQVVSRYGVDLACAQGPNLLFQVDAAALLA